MRWSRGYPRDSLTRFVWPPPLLFGLTVPKSKGGISESPSQPWRLDCGRLVRNRGNTG